jgi:hypothetical protein
MLAGITLLFKCRSNGALLGMLSDYVISATSLKDLRVRAAVLGKKELQRLAVEAKTTCEFLGLYDTYYVCGPLKSGALLGYASTWSIKAKALRPRMNQAQIRKALPVRAKGAYVFDAVYAIDPQKLPNSQRGIIEASFLVELDGKSPAIEIAGRMINSLAVKSKMTRDLRYQKSPAELELIGYSGIRKWASCHVGLGECFRCNVKSFTRESSINKLLHEKKKLVFPKPLR